MMSVGNGSNQGVRERTESQRFVDEMRGVFEKLGGGSYVMGGLVVFGLFWLGMFVFMSIALLLS